MRLDRVYIDGFKNLKEAECRFDEAHLTTVIIGQNGAGKSNLIEAIVEVFRSVDLNRGTPRFRYEVEYQLHEARIILSNTTGKPTITCNEKKLSRKDFDENKEAYFPDLVFGYYSGASRRLEQLFDSHQRRYYDAIKINENPIECEEARVARRLFYCRPIHGIFALLSCFAYPTPSVLKLLKEKLGVTAFNSALAIFREPWYAKSAKRISKKRQGLFNENPNMARALWGAKGPAGHCARTIRDLAFHPIAVKDKPIDDYRDKGGEEEQLGAFIRSLGALKALAKEYKNDADFFAALEATDISDLVRDLHLWVNRTNDETGDISFSDLSDGERQLLMVMGLIRISRGKRALFLLDEPDTHLNPHWQHSYLDLIQEWTEVASTESKCHIIMTSHNPLTIAALKKEEVRVMVADENTSKIIIEPPYTDPRGMGFTATLTEIFGLPTSLDPETQRAVDERNTLAQISKRSANQQRQLIEINDKLNRLGFMFEDREPLYNNFLQSWKDVRYAARQPLSPAQVEARRNAMSTLIKHLITEGGGTK